MTTEVRLRQVVLAAPDLDELAAALRAELGLVESHRDPPDYGGLGIANSVMPVGDTFLEVAAPVRPDAPLARFLAARGGPAGYMVLLQCDDLEAAAARAAAAGARIVHREEHPEHRQWHLHPKDVGGALVGLDWTRDAATWRWAGPDWQAAGGGGRVRAIRAVTVSSPAPRATALRWRALFGGRLDEDEAPTLRWDRSAVHFRPWNRAVEQLTGVDLELAGPGTAGADAVELGGVRFRLLPG